MKSNFTRLRYGFTLLETVIAIGVLAVLLTGFMVVFAPAADGIRKSINVQQADRFASTLEEELVTPRIGQSGQLDFKTGFEKSFDWIQKSNNVANALVAYQYRGKLNGLRTDDGTPIPEPDAKGKLPGKDYIVVPIVRRTSDVKFKEDLSAVEGAVYLVKCTQLVFGTSGLTSGTAGAIRDPKPSGSPAATADAYPEAVIAFAAEFHMMPSRDSAYFSGSAFNTKFGNVKNPVFTRNLAVRR